MFTKFNPKADNTAYAAEVVVRVLNADKAHPIYNAVAKAEKKFEREDYIVITDHINRILLVHGGLRAEWLKDSSFLKGLVYRKYYMMPEQYKKLAAELKEEAEYALLVSNANNAINSSLTDLSHPLYTMVYQAKSNPTDQASIDITTAIDKILNQLGVDFMKLKDGAFLNGTDFKPFYLTAEAYQQKLEVIRVQALVSASP